MNILKKMASRKLWLAIAGVATGISVALGASLADVQSISTAVQTVIGCVTALVSAVTYIKTEGKIDAVSAEKASAALQEAIEAVRNIADAMNGNKTDDAKSEAADENAG